MIHKAHRRVNTPYLKSTQLSSHHLRRLINSSSVPSSGWSLQWVNVSAKWDHDWLLVGAADKRRIQHHLSCETAEHQGDGKGHANQTGIGNWPSVLSRGGGSCGGWDGHGLRWVVWLGRLCPDKHTISPINAWCDDLSCVGLWSHAPSLSRLGHHAAYDGQVGVHSLHFSSDARPGATSFACLFRNIWIRTGSLVILRSIQNFLIEQRITN